MIAYIESKRPMLSGFRYWWAKHVTGFNENEHCIRSLGDGQISKRFKRSMPVNTNVELGFREGEIVYFCGVASTWKWEDNFHLVGIAKATERAQKAMSNGDTLIITGLQELAFDDKIAQEFYGTLPKSYTTCRNFQFAAQAYHTGLIGLQNREKVARGKRKPAGPQQPNLFG